MGERGPQRAPNVVQLRRGKPGQHALPEGVKLPPARLVEPDWRRWMPAVRGVQSEPAKRMRATAKAEWQRVVPVLEAQGVVAAVDQSAVELYCVNLAHWVECLRDLAVRGHTMEGERGQQKNGSSTIAGQLSGVVKGYQRAFGLTPSDRDDLSPRDGSGPDDGRPRPGAVR